MPDEKKPASNETSQTEETPEVKPETKNSTGLESNVAALLAYLFGWISGLIFYLIEKDDKFVRFAAMQSILLNVAAFAIYFMLIMFTGIFAAATGGFGLLFGFFIPVFWVGYLIIWIMVMVKAYQNQEWELPIIGKIARNAVK